MSTNPASASPQLSWNALFLNGSVVSLSISLWRARTKIKAEDLGIDDTADVKAALSLGCHRLAPAKAFDDIMTIAHEAHKTIDQLSMNFGLIKGARYIPERNLALLTGELTRLKAEFNQAVSDFMANYETTKAQMLPVIREALNKAAKNQEAADAAYLRIQAEYPDAGQVLAKFSMVWSVYAVKSPKSAEAQRFAQQETEEVKSIVADMVKQLRDETSETLKTIISLATKGGKLNKRTVDAAQATIQRIESLNILGDQVLTDQLAAMRRALALVDRSEVDSGFVSGLTQIQTTLQTSLTEAIAEAERNLTGVGQRMISIDDDDEGVANEAVDLAHAGAGNTAPLANGHTEASAFEGL